MRIASDQSNRYDRYILIETSILQRLTMPRGDVMPSAKAFSEYEEKIIHFLADKVLDQDSKEVATSEWPEHESKSEVEIWQILDRFERIGLIDIISEDGSCIPQKALLTESREIKYFETHKPKGFLKIIWGGIRYTFRILEIITHIFSSH